MRKLKTTSLLGQTETCQICNLNDNTEHVSLTRETTTRKRGRVSIMPHQHSRISRVTSFLNFIKFEMTCYMIFKIVFLVVSMILNIIGLLLLLSGYNSFKLANTFRGDFPDQLEHLKNNCKIHDHTSNNDPQGCQIFNLKFNITKNLCSPTFPKICKKCLKFKTLVEFSQHRETIYKSKLCNTCAEEINIEYVQAWSESYFDNFKQKNLMMEWESENEIGDYLGESEVYGLELWGGSGSGGAGREAIRVKLTRELVSKIFRYSEVLDYNILTGVLYNYKENHMQNDNFTYFSNQDGHFLSKNSFNESIIKPLDIPNDKIGLYRSKITCLGEDGQDVVILGRFSNRKSSIVPFDGVTTGSGAHGGHNSQGNGFLYYSQGHITKKSELSKIWEFFENKNLISYNNMKLQAAVKYVPGTILIGIGVLAALCWVVIFVWFEKKCGNKMD